MTDQILSPENVRIVPGGATRDEAIREAGRVLVDAGAVDAAYVDSMLERESTVSTYMGNWLAIPHGTNEAKDLIRKSALTMLRYEQPIDWGGEPARFVVGIAGLGDEHLEILSKIAIVFSDEDQVNTLLAAGSSEELHALLSEVNES
ncbi:PTS sugar transporter subunit IIA [Agromyces aurantiacus]|uniref:Mannitol-specific phosphotransferase enzyme IIA component n=1 Tax=Agromyces aurantiacus TaxID=165814 RepID=A0ABV9R1G2_9MICO|nr:PTS sugar transporter subunit IIA [Agromyces aurantiacus]MBM7505683.1 PTS system mannitol-specific IIA component [Agromyces aurantiacus]